MLELINLLKAKMNILKKHSGLIVLTIIIISLDVMHRELFFSILLSYGLLIKFFLSDFLRNEPRKILSIIIWSCFAIILGLTIYVNYYLPHGPSCPTGEIVCKNDDRGPCGEEYREDLQNVDIPEWAKFLRKSEGNLILMGLCFAGIAISIKKDA